MQVKSPIANMSEIQNENEKVMWRGQISNNRKGFDTLLEKLRTIEGSNNDKVRGLSGVKLVISDGHKGIMKSVKESFPGSLSPSFLNILIIYLIVLPLTILSSTSTIFFSLMTDLMVFNLIFMASYLDF